MEHSKVNKVLFLNTFDKIKLFIPLKLFHLYSPSCNITNICPNFSFLNFSYFERKKKHDKITINEAYNGTPRRYFYLFGNDNKCIMNKNIVSTLSITFYLLKKSNIFYALWQFMLRAVMFVLYWGKDFKYMAQHLLNSFDKCVKPPQSQP